MTDVDVLIVGAGPTGLTLAGELEAAGVTFRIVDRAADSVHESRALAVQARTLEVLARLGAATTMVDAGNPASKLVLHLGRRTISIPLFDEGNEQTAFPFLLLLSQARTEQILAERLHTPIERGTALASVAQDAEGATSTMEDGSVIRSRYVVGCDGAHSAVRHAIGIGFAGSAFPQTFALADLEADGLEPGLVHGYPAGRGVMFLFPLGSPATWRMLAMLPAEEHLDLTLGGLQGIVDAYSPEPVVLHDPVWVSEFTIQSRRAERFRLGRVFLAGDAAHIHSPAGGQGMNTGIQDAVNLGWKLGLVCRGLAGDTLLASYEAERVPVARELLRTTDRLFRLAVSGSPLLRFLRPRLAGIVASAATRVRALRRAGFRAISELGISYRHGPLSVEGGPRLHGGPRAGDRLPDAPLTVDGTSTTLHASVSPTAFQLLLCGPWSAAAQLTERWADLVQVSRLTDATALDRLGLGPRDTAQYLVRPDGYIAYRAGGEDLTGLENYLRRVLNG